MTIQEIREGEAGKYVDLVVLAGGYYAKTKIRQTDTYSDNTWSYDYFLMDEDEYNDYFRLRKKEKISFASMYGDVNAKVLLIKIP